MTTGTNMPTQRDENTSAHSDEGTGSDAALRAILDHHAALGRDLAARVDDVLAAVRHQPDPAARHGIADEALVNRGTLVTFLLDQLLPHASTEERTLYPAAAADPHTASLVWAMLDEHRALIDLVHRLQAVADPIELVATAAALRTLFTVHVHKENEYLLPALRRSGVDLEAVLSDTHHLLAATDGEGVEVPARRGTDQDA